jgi:hypothetical protein
MTTRRLTPTDRAALQLAIEMRCKRGQAERERIDADLKHKTWFEVARSCAWIEQHSNLRLRPWQPPPCQADPYAINGADDGVMGRRAAALLLTRMLKLGVSRWHPDPLAAIEQAEVEAQAEAQRPD